VPGAQGVHRVADLLRAIASRGAAGARLVDLARQCRLEPPTTHRLLKALDAEGLVARDPSARTYTLGPLTFELGLAAAHHFRARDLCAQALQAIAEHTGDTVFLSMRSGLDTVCIDRREGRFPIKTLTLDVGTRRPLGLGAGGLALLAALDDAEIDAVLGANAWRLAAYGGMRAPVLLDMVRRTRKLGYALNDRQATPGAMSVGLAIPAGQGAPVLAISVGAIASRMQPARQREIAKIVRGEIRSLST
jgi:DNA-binding IclR family transcriptional regulator